MFDLIILIIINIFLYKWIGVLWFGIELLILIGLLIYLWIKKYRPVIDSVSLFTGAPGTGKTKLMTDLAIEKYKSLKLQVKVSNFFTKIFNKFRKNKKDLQEIPILVSNYPILIKKKSKLKNLYVKLHNKMFKKKQLKLSKNEFNHKITKDILLLQERLPYKSVIAISEFGSLISNQDYKNIYAKVNLDEFIRFVRQYTKGGYFFGDDQSSDNIIVFIRRRIGKVYNMMSLKKIPLLKIGIVRIRHISISEDIKVIETGQAESLKNNTSWLPVFFYKKTYDTHAFSERIKDTPITKTKQYKDFKTNELLSIPFVKSEKDSNYKKPKTNNKD